MSACVVEGIQWEKEALKSYQGWSLNSVLRSSPSDGWKMQKPGAVKLFPGNADRKSKPRTCKSLRYSGSSQSRNVRRSIWHNQFISYAVPGKKVGLDSGSFPRTSHELCGSSLGQRTVTTSVDCPKFRLLRVLFLGLKDWSFSCK